MIKTATTTTDQNETEKSNSNMNIFLGPLLSGVIVPTVSHSQPLPPQEALQYL